MKFRELQGRRFGKSEIRLERAQDDKHTKSARWKLLAKGDIELSNTRSEAPDPANGS
jgi:hypothetical protein